MRNGTLRTKFVWSGPQPASGLQVIETVGLTDFQGIVTFATGLLEPDLKGLISSHRCVICITGLCDRQTLVTLPRDSGKHASGVWDRLGPDRNLERFRCLQTFPVDDVPRRHFSNGIHMNNIAASRQ